MLWKRKYSDEPKYPTAGSAVFNGISERRAFGKKYRVITSDLDNPLNLGLSVIEWYEKRKSISIPDGLLDGIIETGSERKKYGRTMDTLVAATAIQYALFSGNQGTSITDRLKLEGREIRYGVNGLTVLKKLGTKQPYAQIATTSIELVRQTLLDYYLADDRLSNPDDRTAAADMIGHAIFSAQVEEFKGDTV